MYQLALPHLDAYVDQNVHAAPYLSGANAWHPNSLLDYLAAGRKLHMQDPRDRLYAFLDVATGEDHRIIMNPNYKDTALQIYHSFAVNYIQSARRPSILDYVVHSTQSLQSGNPTWVPSLDYQERGPSREGGFITMNPYTSAARIPTLVDRNLLKVHTVVLGSVQYVSSTLDGDNITFETLRSIWTTVQSRPHPCRRDSDLSRMLLSTFIQNGDSGDPQEFARLVTTYIECLEAANGLQERSNHIKVAVDFSKLDKWIRLFADARKFMLLERDYMGLGPAVAQEGDVYGIIFGCTSPCILRKTNKTNCFQFIGQCYIPGGHSFESWDGHLKYPCLLGAEDSKDWVDWDVEEQNIFLC